MRIRTRWLAFALAAGALACKEGRTAEPVVTKTPTAAPTVSPSGTSAAKAGKSMVRFINAIPSKHDVDLAGDDRTLFTDVKYEQVTRYAEVVSNVLDVRLMPKGRDTTLAESHEMVRDGERYTVVAIPQHKGPDVLRILHDEVAPPVDKTRIRVVNASPDVTHADIAFQGQRIPLFHGVAATEASAYTDFAPMSGTIEVRRDVRGAKLLLLPKQHFRAGRSYTIVIAGSGSHGVKLFTIEDAVLDPLAAAR